MTTTRRYEERTLYYSSDEDSRGPVRRGPPSRGNGRGGAPIYGEGPPPSARGGDYEPQYERCKAPRRENVPVREREREDDRESRVPAFLRDDGPRRAEAGPMVLRRRDIETVERPRPKSVGGPMIARRPRERSPSPVPTVASTRRGGGEEIREREVRTTRVREESRGPPESVFSGPSRRGGGEEIREREVRTRRVVEEDRAPPESVFSGPSRRGPRSPSPEVVERERIRTRYVERAEPRRERSPSSPTREREVERTRINVVEREDRRRERSPSPLPPPIRDREFERTTINVREREDRFRERSPSPLPPVREREVTRISVREREDRMRERSPSPSPVREREVERTTITLREKQRAPSPSPSRSPSPPPAPMYIREPTIEREVITHYRAIDHGTVYARQRSPSPARPPPPRQKTEDRKIDIDIRRTHEETDIDIRERSSKSRARSRSRSSSASRPRGTERSGRGAYHEDDLYVTAGRDQIKVDFEHSRGSRGGEDVRRARSAAPFSSRGSTDYSEEAEYITSRINERGQAGEARYGATRDWTLVDVPPGTERVRMDGAGGGGADVTWQRYSGARKAQFTPMREEDAGALVAIPRRERNSDTSESTTIEISDKHRERNRDTERSRIQIDIHDEEREREKPRTRPSRGGEERERDLDIEIERQVVSTLPPAPPTPEAAAPETDKSMWTEIPKDLVVREAIQSQGYDFEETERFFFVMQYLTYAEVCQLADISDSIRRNRTSCYGRHYDPFATRDEVERNERYRRSRSSHYQHGRGTEEGGGYDYGRSGRAAGGGRDSERERERVTVDREVVYERPRAHLY